MLALNRIGNDFPHRYSDRLITIDSHTQGEPTRLLVQGVGTLPGATMAEKRDYFKSHYDHVRLLLTREPRGHGGIMAAVVTEPVSAHGQLGLFYMDARRYPYLCGHATIGAVAALIDSGGLATGPGEVQIIVDTPSGPLNVRASVHNGRALSVAIEMVPAFVFDTNREIDVPGFGKMVIDLVCVGGFFAMISARSSGIALIPANHQRLIALGMAVIEAANQTVAVHHPQRPEVATVDVAEFYDQDRFKNTGASVVIFGESRMDRSPCGTGTTAKMALLHHKGALDLGCMYRNTGPLGTVFEGRIVRRETIGPFAGIVGEIRGNAQITGYHQFVVDSRDPFPEGFML